VRTAKRSQLWTSHRGHEKIRKTRRKKRQPPIPRLNLTGRGKLRRPRCVGLHLPRLLQYLADASGWGESAHHRKSLFQGKGYLLLGQSLIRSLAGGGGCPPTNQRVRKKNSWGNDLVDEEVKSREGNTREKSAPRQARAWQEGRVKGEKLARSANERGGPHFGGGSVPYAWAGGI